MDELTSVQLSEWEAYDKLDPIGKWREDFNFASLKAFIMNIVNAIYAEKGKEIEPSTSQDFMPIWDEHEAKRLAEKKAEKQSLEDLRAALLSFAASHNRAEQRKANKGIKKQPKTPPPSWQI